MRITAHRMLDLAAQASGKAQSDVAELAGQVSSGKRVDSASDDPVAWVQARRLELRRAMSEGRGAGLDLGRDQLAETDRALGTVGDVVLRAKEAALQLANGSVNATDRAALQESVRGLFEVARAAANTRTSSGEYLLAGALSTTEPFDAAGNYVGDAATRSLETGEVGSGVVSIPGTALTAASGVDILPALQRFITALGANDRAGIDTAIGELTTGHEQISRARAQTGGMIAVLDDAGVVRDELEDTLTGSIAAFTEIDLVSAATQLAQRSQALEAAQTVNARLAALLKPAR